MLARAVAAGCAAVLLTACAAEAEPVMPPLTPEPELPLFATSGDADPRSEPGADGRKARQVLQRVLRGAGAGRTGVCANVAPAYAQANLGGTCAAWVAALGPEDRARLSVVKVPKAVPGDGQDVWVVRAADLVWPQGAPTTPSARRYVLRLKGARWVLSG